MKYNCKRRDKRTNGVDFLLLFASHPDLLLLARNGRCLERVWSEGIHILTRSYSNTRNLTCPIETNVQTTAYV